VETQKRRSAIADDHYALVAILAIQRGDINRSSRVERQKALVEQLMVITHWSP